MATGRIIKYNIKLSVTSRDVGTFSGSLAAHTGKSLGTISVDVPDGYRFLGNLACNAANIIGVYAIIDGADSVLSDTPLIYIFNASNRTVDLSELKIWILSMFERV